MQAIKFTVQWSYVSCKTLKIRHILKTNEFFAGIKDTVIDGKKTI